MVVDEPTGEMIICLPLIVRFFTVCVTNSSILINTPVLFSSTGYSITHFLPAQRTAQAGMLI